MVVQCPAATQQVVQSGLQLREPTRYLVVQVLTAVRQAAQTRVRAALRVRERVRYLVVQFPAATQQVDQSARRVQEQARYM